ncbi:hypothetical protein N781_02975 [Pontibacillus halophilus JSM 076056 = DSM 19796]|uniref:Uncharacterized protein n=1 Tax=Pontibacillus halophilus JSM 076056 = DSM 19796 TaxID=1385510 RepID=A0A0A5GFR4_9BACI|nr:hypothetical protein [Pontibacillus halophilus]KGX92076.1 hypothetical protein N781_02975 [Pontibacillus halophilus JSM 076056 = DSM 19796]
MQHEQSNGVLIALTVITFISSMILPFILVPTIQDVLFFSKEHWMFVTPFSAYITGVIGLVASGVTLLVLLFAKIRTEYKDKKFSLFHYIWVVPILVGTYYLAIHSYMYVQDDGIHYRQLGEFSATHLAWEDVTRVEKVIINDRSQISLEGYELEDSKGNSYFIENSAELRDNEYKILDQINHVEVTVTEKEKE